MSADHNADWRDQPERAAPWAVALIVWIARNLGRSFARALLWPTVLYFQITGPAVRKASREFMARVLNRPPRWTDTFRQLFNFSACALDRVFVLTGRYNEFDIRIDGGGSEIQRFVFSGGALMLTSHFGSFDVLRAIFKDRRKLNLRIVMDRLQGRMITEVMTRLNPEFAGRVIDANSGPGLVLQLHQAMQEGSLIGMMADRRVGDDPGIAVDFLGGRARLPSGPWKLAAALGMPVIACFGIYEGGNRYHLFFETFAVAEKVPRAERAAHAAAAAQAYARRLEHYARLAPYNWFNFFDFWPDESTRD